MTWIHLLTLSCSLWWCSLSDTHLLSSTSFTGCGASFKSTPPLILSEQLVLYTGWDGHGRGRDLGVAAIMVEIHVKTKSINVNTVLEPTIFFSAVVKSLVDYYGHKWWIMILFRCFWFWYGMCYYFSLILSYSPDFSS